MHREPILAHQEGVEVGDFEVVGLGQPLAERGGYEGESCSPLSAVKKLDG